MTLFKHIATQQTTRITATLQQLGLINTHGEKTDFSLMNLTQQLGLNLSQLPQTTTLGFQYADYFRPLSSIEALIRTITELLYAHYQDNTAYSSEDERLESKESFISDVAIDIRSSALQAIRESNVGYLLGPLDENYIPDSLLLDKDKVRDRLKEDRTNPELRASYLALINKETAFQKTWKAHVFPVICHKLESLVMIDIMGDSVEQVLCYSFDKFPVSQHRQCQNMLIMDVALTLRESLKALEAAIQLYSNWHLPLDDLRSVKPELSGVKQASVVLQANRFLAELKETHLSLVQSFDHYLYTGFESEGSVDTFDITSFLDTIETIHQKVINRKKILQGTIISLIEKIINKHHQQQYRSFANQVFEGSTSYSTESIPKPLRKLTNQSRNILAPIGFMELLNCCEQVILNTQQTYKWFLGPAFVQIQQFQTSIQASEVSLLRAPHAEGQSQPSQLCLEDGQAQTMPRSWTPYKGPLRSMSPVQITAKKKRLDFTPQSEIEPTLHTVKDVLTFKPSKQTHELYFNQRWQQGCLQFNINFTLFKQLEKYVYIAEFGFTNRMLALTMTLSHKDRLTPFCSDFLTYQGQPYQLAVIKRGSSTRLLAAFREGRSNNVYPLQFLPAFHNTTKYIEAIRVAIAKLSQ